MRCKPHIVVAMGLMVLVWAGSGFAQDWSQWRGAQRDGKSQPLTVPQTWPETLTRQWTVTVGAGDATGALVGDHLYSFGRMEADEVTLCLQAADGKEVWRDQYPADFEVGGPARDHGGPRGSVAVAEGKVVTLGIGGILSCLDAKNGEPLWRKQSIEDYQGVAYQFDTTMSPLLAQGLCVVHLGNKDAGTIMAFDLKTGQRRWICTGHSPACASPALMTVDGIELVVTLTDKNLLLLDLDDGRICGQIPFGGQRGNNITPIIQNDGIILSSMGQGVVAFAVQHTDDQFWVTQQWSNPASQLEPRFTTPVIHGQLLFGYGKKLFALDLKTHEICWEGSRALGGSTALVNAGDAMVALGVKGELVLFAPTAEAYQELTHYTVSDKECWAHPIVTDQRFFIRDTDSVSLWTLTQ